jgi:hypothetical protein
MTDRARQAAGAAPRGYGAGRDARDRATHSVAGEDAARLAKARRNAWFLAGVAMFFYFGYMAWMFVRGTGG